MRIAVVSSSPAWRGTATILARLSAGLEARGHAVVRAAPRGGARGLVDLWRTLRQASPEVVLVDQPRDAILAAAVTWVRPMPLLYRYNRTEGRRVAGAVERRAASRLQGCLYQSGYVQAQALAHEPWLRSVPAWVVPNGFDAEWFRPDPSSSPAFRARHGIGPDTRIVLTAGALVAGKGHELGVAALERVRRRGCDLVYVLAGDGPRREELRRLAVEVGVALRDLGWLDAAELREAYQAADVVLHPSEHEIFPNAVGEAMACGCAVVASAVGGTPELVGADGRAGMLVSPHDSEAVADAVGALLMNPVRRADVGRAARARIREEYPLSRMVEGTEQALAACAGPRHFRPEQVR